MTFSDPGLLGISILWPRNGEDLTAGLVVVVTFFGGLEVVVRILLVVLGLTVVVVDFLLVVVVDFVVVIATGTADEY